MKKSGNKKFNKIYHVLYSNPGFDNWSSVMRIQYDLISIRQNFNGHNILSGKVYISWKSLTDNPDNDFMPRWNTIVHAMYLCNLYNRLYKYSLLAHKYLSGEYRVIRKHFDNLDTSYSGTKSSLRQPFIEIDRRNVDTKNVSVKSSGTHIGGSEFGIKIYSLNYSSEFMANRDYFVEGFATWRIPIEDYWIYAEVLNTEEERNKANLKMFQKIRHFFKDYSVRMKKVNGYKDDGDTDWVSGNVLPC